MAMIPTESTATVSGQVATLNAKYALIDLETGESMTVAGSGAGYDPSDKHVGKASTYAFKTALLKVFALATTDEDPDVFSSDDNVEQEKSRKKSIASSINTKEALAGYIEDLIARRKMEPGQGPQFKAKVMQIANAEELKQAVDYFSGFDL
jgi:hypothetical protein